MRTQRSHRDERGHGTGTQIRKATDFHAKLTFEGSLLAGRQSPARRLSLPGRLWQPRLMKWLVISMAAVAILAAGVTASADELPHAETTVGIAGRAIIVSQRDDLVPLPPEKSGQQVMVRIVNRAKADDGQYYEIEYVALKPGKYELSRLLVPPSGEADPTTMGSSVSVGEILPLDAPLRVSDTPPTGIVQPRFYPWFILTLTLLWLACGGWLWNCFPEKKAASKTETPPETLGEYIQRALAEAASSPLTQEQFAVIERMVLTYWQDQLGLQKVKIGEALEQMRRHPRAGPMLGTLAKLHQRGAPEQLDAGSLLGSFGPESKVSTRRSALVEVK